MDLIISCFLTLFGISNTVLGNQTSASCLQLYQLEKSADPDCLCPMLQDYVVCSLRQPEEDHKAVEIFITEEHKLTAGRCDCISLIQRLLFEPEVEALNDFYLLIRVVSYATVLSVLLLLYKLMSPTRLRACSCVLLVLFYVSCLALYIAVNKFASWKIIGKL